MRGGKPEPTVQAEFRGKEYISIFEEAKDWFEAVMFSDFPENLSFASFYSRKVIRIIPGSMCITPIIFTCGTFNGTGEENNKRSKSGTETSCHWRSASLRSVNKCS